MPFIFIQILRHLSSVFTSTPYNFSEHTLIMDLIFFILVLFWYIIWNWLIIICHHADVLFNINHLNILYKKMHVINILGSGIPILLSFCSHMLGIIGVEFRGFTFGVFKPVLSLLLLRVWTFLLWIYASL